MHGYPWRSWNGNEMLHARNMMAYIIFKLKAEGWIMLCSADVSAKYVHVDKGEGNFYSPERINGLTNTIKITLLIVIHYFS